MCLIEKNLVSMKTSFQVDLDIGKENDIYMLEAPMVEKPSLYIFCFRDKIVCRYNLLCSSALMGHFFLSILSRTIWNLYSTQQVFTNTPC